MDKQLWLSKVIQRPDESDISIVPRAGYIMSSEHGERLKQGDESLVGQKWRISNKGNRYDVSIPKRVGKWIVVLTYTTPEVEDLIEQAGDIKLGRSKSIVSNQLVRDRVRKLRPQDMGLLRDRDIDDRLDVGG